MIHFIRFSKLEEALAFINNNGHELISLAYPQDLTDAGDLFNYDFKVIYRDIKNPLAKFKPQFHDCNIIFNLQYNSGEFLGVGDIIRIYEPDEYLASGLYAIYTWIPNLQVYTFVNESTLYDYCTVDFSKDFDLKESVENEILDPDMHFERLRHVKPIGNISDEKWRGKLDQNWLIAYAHMFHF